MPSDTVCHRRIEEALKGIPVIDTHVHLDPLMPLAPDINEVLHYHNYLSELTGATADFDYNRELSPVERARKFVHLSKISSASPHAWMLKKVLKEVYGFDKYIDLEDCEPLYEKSLRMATRENRLGELCEIAGVKKILIHVPPGPIENQVSDPTLFAGLSDLILPTRFNGEDMKILEEKTGSPCENTSDFEAAALSYYNKCKDSGHVGLRADMPVNYTGRKVSRNRLERAFARVRAEDPGPEDRQILQTFALDTAAAAAEQTGMTLQVFLARSIAAGIPMCSNQESIIMELNQYVADHPKVKFDIYTVSFHLTHQLCITARYRHNCHLGGCWWLCQFPQIMSQIYSMRMEMLPPSKWSAFFSDAYVAEWIVGKMALTKKELARVLASKIMERYVSEEQAMDMAQEVLFREPGRLYNIGGM